MKLKPHTPIKYGFDDKSPPRVPEEHAKEGHFTASFDNRLWMFHRRWEPPLDTNIKATLMIVHGTVDHSGVYTELAERLRDSGVSVFAVDMRGWGLSDGESLYIDDIDTFVSDVKALYHDIHSLSRYQTVKSRFLMGKSLGGTVTAYCVVNHPTLWTGLLGLSGAYDIDPKLVPSPVILTMLRGASHFIPKAPLKPLFDEHLIVSDEKALQEWREDELCSKDKFRLGYIVNLFDSVKELQHVKIDLPMFLMYGEDDKVVTLSGQELMLKQNCHPDKQLKLYPNGYHNLLQEPMLKEQVMSDVEAWVLSHA